MWFGVLGPLLVRDGDALVGVPGTRQRVLLAALLLQVGTVVSADALAETMWDGMPPAGAVTTLRTHVLRLRRALGPAAGARIVTRYPGYAVEAGEDEVDLLRFAGLCREGGAAMRSSEWMRAAGLLGQALELWRGDLLADVPAEMLRRDAAPRLEQLRLQAVEWQTDARLHQGSHAELIPELQFLTVKHPLRERFHAQLMLALYRCGRQGEALEAYQHARGKLVEELGAEPGAELRELHQRILAADPALAAREPAPLVADGSVVVTPRELPAPVAHFAGRARELTALTELLDHSAGHGPGAIVISAIGGTAGVGKTALAVHWAHQVAGRFPHGQLYVNLRGYDPDRPVTASDALAGFLRSLGVPGQDIPAEESQRAARYRSTLAGRRVMVVLDNAGEVEQVRPLLPGSPTCAVVVTSRDSLVGLVARDGAERLDLDLLPLGDALDLLRALIGARVDTSALAAEALANQCCRLPLALRVAAEFAAARPAMPLAELADELADQQKRLDLLEAGNDPRTAVRAVFSWSYRHLDPAATRAFRLLAMHPGPDFDACAATALTGASLPQARRLLDVLAQAHLIMPVGTGRYGMHDLLRAYARDLAITQDPDDERLAALTCLFDHYLYTAAAAMDVLFPAERHRRPVAVPSSSPGPPLTNQAEARGWLDAERVNLVATTAHAAECGWPDHAIRLAATVFRYLESAGHYPEIAVTNRHARRAAGDVSDSAAEAEALNNLAIVDVRQGRYQQAADHLEQALLLYQQAGDRTGEARALNNLGFISTRLGWYQRATGHLQQAVTLFRQAGYLMGEAHALDNLGVAAQRQGFSQQAIDYLEQALSLFRETGDPTGEAYTLTDLAEVCLRQGRHEQAVGHLQLALTLCRQTGDRSAEAQVLNGLGEAFRAAGQVSHSRTQHETALDLASRIGDKHQQARAFDGLGHACHASGETDLARLHWQRAVTLYTELGVPEAEEVRARMSQGENHRTL